MLANRSGSGARGTRAALGVLGAAGALALLSACGGGSDFADQPADKIVETSKTDMMALDSLKLEGTIASDGQDVALDLQVSSSGDCTGTFGVGDGTAEILGVDGTNWFRPDEAFWRATAGAQADMIISTVGDKWVALPPDDESFDQFCDLDQLLDQVLASDEDGVTYKTDGIEKIDGEDAVKVDRDSEKDGPSTGYVLVDGKHYIVKIEKTGDEGGSIAFTGFNEDFDVSAPGDDEVVDLSSLG
jgi:hypothetical protein